MADVPPNPAMIADREQYRAAPPEAELQELFARIAADTVDAEPSPTQRLAELPTVTRILFGFGGGLVLSAVVVGVIGLRVQSIDADSGRMLLTLLGMALFGGLALASSLRGLHQRSLGSFAWLVAGVALLLPLLMALLPGWWPGVAVPDMMPWQSECFWFGAGVAAATAGGAVMLQRTAEPPLWRVLSAAGAGGIVGFIAQQLFCPASGTWHLVTAHGLLGMLVAVLLVGVLKLRAALRST